MTSKGLVIVGLLFVAGGLAGLVFVTVPAIYGIAEGVGNTIEGEDTTEGIVDIIFGGIVLYFTTGLFIISTALGGALASKGAVA
jgi:hypothetical protein